MPKKPADPRFPLSSIVRALKEAGLPEPDRDRVLERLQMTRRKPGPKGKDDSDIVNRVIDLAEEMDVHFNTAAAIISREHPEREREALRKRVARKAKQMEAEGQAIIDAAARRIVVQQEAEREELRRLRALAAAKKI
jgi:hypothetical protein